MGRVIRERVLGTGAPGTGFDKAEAAQVRNQLTEMPTVIAGNYTKRLANYNNLAAAIADLPDAGAQGGEIQVDGEPLIEDTNTIPDNLHLIGRGMGATRLRLKNTTNWPVLYVNGTSNVLLADMAVTMESGTGSQASQAGLQLSGTCDNVHAERILIDGMSSGVRAVGASVGSITGLTLRDLVVLNTVANWGVEVSNVDGWVADNLRVENSLHDGLKVAKTTHNGKVIGGFYNHNGQEGIDAFTGGQNLIFIGVTADDNIGSGIIVKTDNVTYDDPTNLAPRNLQFIGCSLKRNGGHGLGVYKMASGGYPADINDQISLAQVNIIGGEYLDNKMDGIYSNARNVTMSAPRASRNGRHGLYFGQHALHNSVSVPVLTGNGRLKHLAEGSYTSFGNKAANLWIQGTGIFVDGGIYIGTDADDVSNEADLIGRFRTASYNVYVDTQASDVEVRPDKTHLQAEAGRHLRAAGTGAGIKLHHKEAATYPGESQGFTGGPGSTYTRLTPNAEEPFTFVKTAGAANDPLGWVPVGLPRIANLPTAQAGYRGWTVVQEVSGADRVMQCVKTGASTYAWKQVSLT